MLDRVDRFVIGGIVIEQDLDRIRAGFHQPPYAPLVQQVWQASLDSGVVAGLLVGQQHAAIRCLGLQGEQAELRIDQDRARMRRQDRDDGLLEGRQIVGGRLAILTGLANRFLQRSPLIHGGR